MTKLGSLTKQRKNSELAHALLSMPHVSHDSPMTVCYNPRQRYVGHLPKRVPPHYPDNKMSLTQAAALQTL
ncbi:hypothetical protein [Salinivibrio kushneri]|uniref:hypothetical protein n=1 Tax=Salinivibrio kushneri TaxID=1908198 RepID=UPI0022B30EF3|nr:hypothetical protein [Salinivibrio kushneri]WBA19505.1 hypothetical protein O4598_13000 [Salinivibrio kushneri]